MADSAVFRSLVRTFAVARKEAIHLRRDWRSLLLALAIPVLLILLFGYALTLDLKNVPTVVWDQSRTPPSRDFLALVQGSAYFELYAMRESEKELRHDLDAGRAMVALVIPSDFAEHIAAGRPVTVEAVVDGSDANTSRLAASYCRGLGLIFNRRLTVDARPAGVTLVSRAWYNPALRSPNALLPGIVAIVMMVIAAMLTSVTVAREWETGTMEQLIGTPVRAGELIGGKVLPYFVVGMVDVAIAVGLSRWLFHVPLRGHPGLLFATAAVFLTGALFFGLTLSIRFKTQVLANQIALAAGFLPTLILSGFVFAIENMPTALQYLTYIVPARYLIAIMRGIFMKGIGLEILWLDALLLFVYALAMIAAARGGLKLRLE
ncbi:MAG: ABC transporter permease [Desulfobacterales bacterium]|jgi:ABC-2 type transport system permease protein|nr:ABC transporter permease [Desulfobacteraceae bacterium]MDD3990584.1 ABC transporter permease [Desulfobacteraceae bacterium]MDY0310778.1 ABC transporter permease [Desulfobacterales bacterium]